MKDFINIDGINIARKDMGDAWINFEKCLTPETAIIFNSSYNLIVLTLTTDSLSLDVTHILVNEQTETTTKVNSVRMLFIQYMVDILAQMGVSVDRDHIELNSLYDLVTILNSFLILNDLEDQIGITAILEDNEISNKDKLIEVIKRINLLEDDENYPFIISDVSIEVINAIQRGITEIDDTEIIDSNVIKRIRANKEILKGTIGGTHVIDGGGLGLSFDALFTLNEARLGEILITDKITYYKEILSLLLISSMTDAQLQESFEVMVGDYSSDPIELIKGSKLIEEVILDEQG